MSKQMSRDKAARVKADIADSKGRNQSQIAKKHRISRSTVSDIATERIHKDVPWPEGYEPVPNKKGGQHNVIEECDPTNERILELESELVHLKEERNRVSAKYKASAKTQGLFRALVKEMDTRVRPYAALPRAHTLKAKKGAIKEHLVMHLSDMHADQVVVPEECGGLENFNFPIACARAERYVDTVIEWVSDTLYPKFNFTDLWILSYGDQTSGEIHGHAQRSYFRNQFRNSYAIGQLQALMIRDLAPHFSRIHVVCLPGNHGRRSVKKDHHGANDNWDYLIAELARMHCRDLDNVSFTIPDAWSVNLNINGVGFCVSHGDDIKSNGGVPFYGFLRRQKGLIALNSLQYDTPIRYFVCGHHHVSASLADIKGELLVNGAWVGTDAYSYNSFSGYREPSQWLHGVNPVHGITWRLNVKLKHDREQKGPRRYLIDGGRDVGPIQV